ncbi:MAG: LPS translocon maturation chaperone LptM [Salinarimonas sp.]
MILSSRAGRALLIAGAIVLTLSACGRRGPPEAPPAAAERQTVEQEGRQEAQEQTPPARPDRPFLLDALL